MKPQLFLARYQGSREGLITGYLLGRHYSSFLRERRSALGAVFLATQGRNQYQNLLPEAVHPWTLGFVWGKLRTGAQGRCEFFLLLPNTDSLTSQRSYTTKEHSRKSGACRALPAVWW